MFQWQRLGSDIIIKSFGKWVVTNYGVETADGAISIEIERLWEPDWERWMEGKKSSLGHEDFTDALTAAREFFADVRPYKIGYGLRYDVLVRDHFRCCLCGSTAKDGVRLEVDHKHPRSKGGKDKAENLWTLCRPCNQGKRAKILPEDIYDVY